MREFLKPFTYQARYRFTNRKHRTREIVFPIESDAVFELMAVYTQCEFPFRFVVYDGAARALEEMSTQLANGIPLPFMPRVRFEKGGTLKISVTLKDGIDVGRARPQYFICLMGSKIYRVQGTANAKPKARKRPPEVKKKAH